MIPLDYYNSTHLFLAPTGFGLKKGQSYYQNILLFGNSYSHGISDVFSITVGGEIASLLFSSRIPILYIAPKFSFEVSNSVSTSVGAIFFTSPQEDFTGVGLAYGALSFGYRNNNLSLGAAFVFSSGNGFEPRLPGRPPSCRPASPCR